MTEERFVQLEEAKPISQSTFPKIQKVPNHLRNREKFTKYYSPKLLSLGPIHHGNPNLELGEQYKLTWASMYIQSCLNQNPRDVYEKISSNIQELKKLYTEDALGEFKAEDETLSWMLFIDGCSLLQILGCPDILKPELLGVKVDQMALIRQDVLLLENQLPFHVLRLLCPYHNDGDIMRAMNDFLQRHQFSQKKPTDYRSVGHNESGGVTVVEMDDDPRPHAPPHLLDQLRWNLLRDFHPQPYEDVVKMKDYVMKKEYRNINELRAAGIKVMRSKSKCPIDISFSAGLFSSELKIHKFVIDDTTEPTYLNLLAYEACPDFSNKYEISSYVEFLDSLIDHPDDVKALRDAGILHNGLGSDNDMAELFNTVSSDVVSDASIYAGVRDHIERHYRQKHKKWFRMCYHRHCSNPWAIIAFLVAFLVLSLTFVQTWFAVFQPAGSH